VQVPSAMIAFSDSHLVQIDGKEIIGTIDLEYIPITFRSTLPSYPAELKAANERHEGRHVTAFCDGHVESIKFTRLFADDPEVRRLWNYDNQPHATPFD
jgi:prepilin-type processing-associated H-X9-DG protein